MADVTTKPTNAEADAPDTGMSPDEMKSTVIAMIKAIDKGPRAVQMYMEMCAKCGVCAAVCPVYYGAPEKRYNPAERTEIIRRVYKKYNTTSGRLLGKLVGAEDFDPADIDEWVRSFYECTGCRRCAVYCPFGIDHSVITRKGRAIVDKVGKTPETMKKVVAVSLETGNTDGVGEKGFWASIDFLKEEMEEQHGKKIPMPVDVVGAEYFYVPPSGDILVNPEATMGVAKVFHVLGMSDKWTMSSKCFDGANYGLFTGNDADMKRDNKLYIDEAKRLGCKVLLMGECGHAHRIMEMMMEKTGWWGELPFKVRNCMDFTAEKIREGKLAFEQSRDPQPG
ncbi:MAG: (Fe-S)-binding protein, partial [bacterium]|nr:(Fe-S)-binding protein [bacterium]